MVPLLRTCGSPILPASTASAGIAPCTSADAATAACGVSAPISTASPSTAMPASAAIPARSIRSDGAARRCFIVGSNVWPPER